MYKDKQKYLEYQMEWKLKNMERRNNLSKEWKKNNPEKVSISGKKWYQNNLEKRREYRLMNKDRINSNNKKFKRKWSLKHKYGITVTEYEELLKKQNGVCAICSSSETRTYKNKETVVESLCVDHDHKTNKIRGLLCQKCNSAIGLFMENSELLEKAIIYLKNN
jgi:hypothetical protein